MFRILMLAALLAAAAPVRAGVAFKAKDRWAPGTTLRVYFMDGDPALPPLVMQAAGEWSAHANIKFVRVTACPAEVRVSFAQTTAAWSRQGTSCLVYGQEVPTMYLPISTRHDRREVRRCVLHEFGHVLGLCHEHQHPRTVVLWNRPAVHAHYARCGWPAADVETWLFGRYVEAEVDTCDYDPKSVMGYYVPPELLYQGSALPQYVSEISPKDAEFVRRLYPFPEQAAAKPKPD